MTRVTTKPFTWRPTVAFDDATLSAEQRKAYAEGFLRQFWADDRLKEIDLLDRIAEEAAVVGHSEIARHARAASAAIERLIEAMESRHKPGWP